MSDPWGTLNSILNRRASTSESRKNRLAGIVGDIVNRRNANEQSAMDRVLKQQENEKDRTYLDTPFADGPRELRDPVTGTVATYNTPREWEAALQAQRGAQSEQGQRVAGDIQSGLQAEQAQYQQQLQNDAQAFQMDLQDVTNANELAQLQMRIDADKAAAERSWDQTREQYSQRSAVVNGRSYSWNSDQQYALVQLQMQSDLLFDRLAFEKKLDKDATPDLWQAYQDAKNEVLNPSVLDPTTGTWRAVADTSPDALEASFRKALANRSPDLSPEAVEKAVSLFMDFIAQVPDAQAGSEAGGWYTQRPPGTTNALPPGGPTNTPSGPPMTTREPSQAVLDTYSDVPSWVGPNYYGSGYVQENKQYPQGVSVSEQPIYDQLMQILATRKAKGASTNDVQQRIKRLVDENVPANDQEIQSFIDMMLADARRGM